MDLLTTEFLGNALRRWIIAGGVAFVVFLGLRFVALGAIRRLSKAASRTENHWDDVIAGGLDATKSSLVFVLAVFAGSTALAFPERWTDIIESVTIIALLVQAGLWASGALTTWLDERARARAEDAPAEVMTVNILGIAMKLVLWSMVLLLALDNLGIDVTALVAGLGIGGVAVALALQNVLGDLFASLSIVLDKPFVLGDFVIVGDFLGTVEAIGLKTTRVRSLSGEQVVFSNADMLSSRIRNYGRMYERRVVTELGVTYQTPREQLRAIPGLIEDAVAENGGENVRFDRSHMSEYGDFAILFESVYFVLSPDYALHMEIKQAIFLQLHEAFEERGIEFAYPTQTLFLEKQAS